MTDSKQEFRELLKASGWSQAEAARQLAMTPSALSQIVRENSPVKPSAVTLRLFKLLLLRQNPELLQPEPVKPPAPRGAAQWENDLIAALRAIPPQTRESLLEAIGALIKMSTAQSVSDKRPKEGKGRRAKE